LFFSTSVVSNATGVPPCNLQNLGELEQALSNSMFANSQREKMANAILQNRFFLFSSFELGNFTIITYLFSCKIQGRERPFDFKPALFLI